MAMECWFNWKREEFKGGEWVIVGNLCVLLAGTMGTDLVCWRRGMSL